MLNGLGFVKKIFSLPGTRLTPDVVLARTMEKVPRIRAVVVVIQWDDETWLVDWSQMTKADFRCAGFALDQKIFQDIHGR